MQKLRIHTHTRKQRKNTATQKPIDLNNVDVEYAVDFKNVHGLFKIT